jgi:signal transduction histidine kinase
VGAGAVVPGLVVAAVALAHGWRAVPPPQKQLRGKPPGCGWWAMIVRQHRDSERARQALAERLATIAEYDHKSAVADERARMARDLHDVIAGHLSAIAIHSAAALSMVDRNQGTMHAMLRTVRESSVASLSEMRTMIGLLRTDDAGMDRRAPARLRDIGRLLESARAAGLEVHAKTEETGGLPAAVDLSAYRIVQEALTNVVKHAPGSRAEVRVGRSSRTLVIEVINEGVGAVAVGSGRGLLNMRERAHAVGGVLEAGPSPTGRWRVRAELPAGLA